MKLKIRFKLRAQLNRSGLALGNSSVCLHPAAFCIADDHSTITDVPESRALLPYSLAQQHVIGTYAQPTIRPVQFPDG